MLKYTGIFQGEIVEDKIVQAKQLAKELGIDLPKSLVISKVSRGKDKFGQAKEPASVNCPTLVSGTHEGESFFLRYYTREVRKGKDDFSYLPKSLNVRQTKTIDAEKEADVALFLYLHKMCKSGINDGRSPKLVIVDKAAEAKSKMAAQKALNEMKKSILQEEDGEKIMRIARGFEFNGYRIPTTEISDVDTAKLALLTASERYPAQIARAMTDDATTVRGIAGLAIDRGTVYLTTQGWSFTDGQRVCDVKQGQDPESALIEFLSHNENLASFLNKIYQAEVRKINVEIKPENLATREKAEPVDVTVDSVGLLDMALEKGVVQHEPSTGKAYILREGVRQSIPLATGVNTLDDLREKAKGFAPQVIGRLKSVLNQ